MGFTGALVTGVWIGHDDFRPMTWNGKGVTGGSLPAMAWHAYMSVAHNNRAIPPIPGIPLHPNQIADQQRLAELKKTDPGMAKAQIAQAAQNGSGIMPDQTREVLHKLAEAMRRAGDQQGAPGTPAASPGTGQNPPPKARPRLPDRRAEVPAIGPNRRP
jgi:penicillin-binding protein 1A